MGQGPAHAGEGRPQGTGRNPLVPRRLCGLSPSSLRVSRLLAAGLPGGGAGFRHPRRGRAVGGQRRPPAGRRGPLRDARREEHEGDGEGHLPAHRHHRPAHLSHAEARIRPLRPRQAGRALYRAARRVAAAGKTRAEAALERPRGLSRSLLPRPLQRHLRPAAADHRRPGPGARGNAAEPREQLLLRGRRRQDLDAGRARRLASGRPCSA